MGVPDGAGGAVGCVSCMWEPRVEGTRHPTRDHAKRQRAPDVVGHVEAAQEGYVLLPARGEAAGGEGVAEAVQVAGEVVLRSRDLVVADVEEC